MEASCTSQLSVSCTPTPDSDKNIRLSLCHLSIFSSSVHGGVWPLALRAAFGVGLVGLLDEEIRGWACAGEAESGGLGGAKSAEQIGTGDLLEIARRVAPAKELGEKSRIGRDVFEPLRYGGDAVEVSADADVVDPGDVAQVVDVIGDIRESCVRTRVLTLPGADLGEVM